jgi:thiamine-monophosphate kinase
MRVSDIGEFGLIERLMGSSRKGSGDLVVGPGDDAAVWRAGEELVVATTDTMVDGVHFRGEGANWRDIGWKLLAVNVSDIAAMGGAPESALVTLCLPPETEVAAIDELYEGLNECGHKYGVTVAGGDVVRSPVTVLTAAVLGRGEMRDREPALLLRSGARPGDVVAVTGTLGGSAGGLRRLAAGAASDDPLVRRHIRPLPRIMEGRAGVAVGVRCGIDVSDGLLQDLGHVCEASGVGAIVHADTIPVSGELRVAYPDEALEMACTGGEDYELLLTGQRKRMAGLPVTVIGEIVAGSGLQLIDGEGREIQYERKGWDAFRS